ncbi:molybdopterin-binding protein [Thalassospiraceae bacterium LMO-SO8]|nr:molybdopterin-binding protein [Alphaproteobacteria bacterium LMO-S08]WND76175.1 molybdopterin-binding protein [Thalassospiraceae bacterium LMO-SO8]
MNEPKTVTACLIIIGNEILSGRTRDANLQFLGENLNALGIRLMEGRVIPDVEATIIANVNDARARFDYVFTTGGIGPTHDDITSACVAKAFGRRLIRHPDAEKLLLAHYKPEDVTEARMKMADVPEGSILLDNPVSRAPGFQVDNVFVLPGVPRIMQAMFDLFKHRLTGGAEMLSKSIASYTPEGKIAARLTALQDAYPALEIGSYPFSRDGKHGSTIVIRGTDAAAIAEAAEKLRTIMRDLGNEPQEVDL